MTTRKQLFALALLSAVALFSAACPPPAACSDASCPSGTVCAPDGTCVSSSAEGEGSPGEGEGVPGEGEGAPGEGEGSPGEGEGSPGEGEGEGGFTAPTFAAENEFDRTIAAGQELVFDVVLNDAALPCDVNGANVDPTTLTAAVPVPQKADDTFVANLHCANVANIAPLTFNVLIKGVVVTGLPAIGAPVNVSIQAPTADACSIDGVSFAPSAVFDEPAESTAIREVTCQGPDGGAATTTFLLPVQIEIENVFADDAGVHFDVVGDQASCTGATEAAGAFTQPLAPGATSASIACHAANDALNTQDASFTVFQGDVDATTYDTLAAQLVTGNVALLGVNDVDDRGIVAIGGDFTIEQTTASSLALPSLAIVNGGVTVAGNAALASIALANLERVGAFDVENNAVLGAINAPLLASVGGDVVVTDNATGGTALKLGLGALLSVGGSVTFVDNPGLSTGTAAGVVSRIDDAGFGVAGGVVISGNGT